MILKFVHVIILMRVSDGDIDFGNMLLGEKLSKEKYENILICDIS